MSTTEIISVIRIKPYSYIHVLDNNSNVTRIVLGPLTYTKKDHESIVLGPAEYILVPPRHYCRIANPVVLEEGTKKVCLDKYGSCVVRHGDEEIRYEQEPFPLYPGEVLVGKITPLKVVADLQALLIKCVRDFGDKVAGDEYLFSGPGTYIPRVEEVVVESVAARIVEPNTALKL